MDIHSPGGEPVRGDEDQCERHQRQRRGEGRHPDELPAHHLAGRQVLQPMPEDAVRRLGESGDDAGPDREEEDIASADRSWRRTVACDGSSAPRHDQGEHRGRRTNAQRQRDENRCREGWLPQQQSDAEAYVLNHCLDMTANAHPDLGG
jgi:hypothetical protein